MNKKWMFTTSTLKGSNTQTIWNWTVQPYLIFGFVACTTLFEHIGDEILLIVFIFAKVSAQRTIVHIPHVSVLNDCRPEGNTACSWLWCRPIDLNLTFRCITCVSHNIAAYEFGQCVIFAHFEGAMFDWREILKNKNKRSFIMLRGQFQMEWKRFTSENMVVMLVFCSTAKKNPVNVGRGRSRLRIVLLLRSRKTASTKNHHQNQFDEQRWGYRVARK